MKMEMEGKEPLMVIFGGPIVTTCIVLVSMHLAQSQVKVVPPPAIHVEAPHVTPQVTAILPAGAIRITNEVPPAQIHEVVREIVKVPKFEITNRLPNMPPPEINISLPNQQPFPAKIIPMPVPVSVKDSPTEKKSPAEKVKKKDPDGRLLPPPDEPGVR